MRRQPITRREALQSASVGIATTVLPFHARAEAIVKPVRFAVIADVHKDVMHDADERLQTFVKTAKEQQVDFVLQLGDFCCPVPENQSFMTVWNSFEGPRYHVLGNHDTDGGFKREQTVEYWDMQSRYYSFDINSLHVVVLDGNDQGPGQKPYFRYIAEDQLNWLRDDLQQTGLPTIVFVHQSPERHDKGGIENGQKVQALLASAMDQNGVSKVVACFTGHHHRDYTRTINGIHYAQINSASYYWLGGNYLTVRYSEDIDKQYPYIKYTVPYKDPLFAMVTVDPRRGFLTIEGRTSEFVGPSPWDLGASRADMEAESLVPMIRDRRAKLGRA